MGPLFIIVLVSIVSASFEPALHIPKFLVLQHQLLDRNNVGLGLGDKGHRGVDTRLVAKSQDEVLLSGLAGCSADPGGAFGPVGVDPSEELLAALAAAGFAGGIGLDVS